MPGSRPTAERTREALFSIWQPRVTGARFLDLFCGSGAAGLEALSRGALTALLVDGDRRAIAVASRNRERLEAQGATTLRLTLPAGIGSGLLRGRIFDLVFADPPYDFTEWDRLLGEVEPLLDLEGEIAVEHTARGGPPERVGRLVRIGLRRYGDSGLSFYRRQSAGPESRNDVSSR